MDTHLNYIIAQQRTAELQQAAARARLAAGADRDQCRSRVRSPMARVGAQLARLGARLAPSRLRGWAHASRLASSHRSTPAP